MVSGAAVLQVVHQVFFYSMLPKTEARTAAPTAAVKVALVDGAALIVVGLHLSVEQHLTMIW